MKVIEKQGRIRDLNGEAVFVVHDDPEQIRRLLLRDLDVPYPILVDLDRRAYRAWGLARGSFWRVWLNPSIWRPLPAAAAQRRAAPRSWPGHAATGRRLHRRARWNDPLHQITEKREASPRRPAHGGDGTPSRPRPLTLVLNPEDAAGPGHRSRDVSADEIHRRKGFRRELGVWKGEG